MKITTYTYHAEIIGKGEPVIFLPAAGFTGNEGKNIADYLQENYETHMVDLPGWGRGDGIRSRCTSLAMATWLRGYLDQQGIQKANVIGHSLGGAIAMTFAIHFPDRVNKLVILDQGHKPFPRIPKSEFGMFAFAFPFFNVLVRIFGMSFLKKLQPMFTSKGDETEAEETDGNEKFEQEVQRFCKTISVEDSEYVRLAVKQLGDLSVEGLNLMFGYYNINLPKLLKKITVPTTLFYGTFENVDDKEYAKTKKSIAKLENVELPIEYKPVPGGHYVHWSDASVLSDIRDFLD